MKYLLVRRARIQFVLAISTGMRQFANAFVIVYQIDAGATILTRIVGAIVDVGFAIGPNVSGQTFTTVTVEMIVTSATVLTRIRAALVDIGFASLAPVSG